MRLASAVGIVTGASRGIGVYIAEALAGQGASLALAARSSEGLAATAAKVEAAGGKAICVPTDVSKREDLERLVDRTAAELGPVSLLVNNAGAEMVGHFETLDPDRIPVVVATNLTAPILLSRLVAPAMVSAGRGHICNIASTAGKVARPWGSVYSATKHGLVGFSWSMRAELATKGVEVSVVCPHYVSETGMFADRIADGLRPPRSLAAVGPRRVADAVVDAIENNRAEVVVAPPVVKLADVVSAVSVDLQIRIARRTGLYDFLRREAVGDRTDP